MVDKLVVLSEKLHPRFVHLAITAGRQTHDYDRRADLRETEAALPLMLSYKGRFDGRHKGDLVGVSKLGLTRTKQVLEEVFTSVRGLQIYRIDFAVDLPGLSLLQLAEMCHIPNVQNFAVIRRRGSMSVYPHRSRVRTVLFYDRTKLPSWRRDSLVAALDPGESLVRIEVQLKATGVPYKSLDGIAKYRDMDLLSGLRVAAVKSTKGESDPKRSLKIEVLRALTSRYGSQGALKIFGAEERSWLKKHCLTTTASIDLQAVKRRLHKSIDDWLEDRIRFPRVVWGHRQREFKCAGNQGCSVG